MLLLWLNCGLFLLFGAGFLLSPEYFAMQFTATSPATTDGLIDMRATYGGLAIGLGSLFGLAARYSYPRLGLQVILITMLALAIGRILGIVIDGQPNLYMLILLGTELVMGLLAGIGLCQTSRQ